MCLIKKLYLSIIILLLIIYILFFYSLNKKNVINKILDNKIF